MTPRPLPNQIHLVAGSSVRRAGLWSQLPGVLVHAYGRRQFLEGGKLPSDIPVLLYETDDRHSETLRFLDQAAARQNDLCIILLGKAWPAEQVAACFRHGAFDYLVWPCSSERLCASMADGLINRCTFIEVRNLSDALAATNQALVHDRDMLAQCNRTLSTVNQLTQTMAASLDSAAIVKTLFTGLGPLFRADMMGLLTTHPERLWTWSRLRNHAREAALRRDLQSRWDRARNAPPSQDHERPHLVPSSHRHSTAVSVEEPPSTLHPAVCTVPLTIGLHHAFLHIERPGRDPFTEQERQLLTTVAGSVALSLRNAEAYQHVHELALHDPLTGLMNRRALDSKLTGDAKAGRRYGTPACLMLLDLDFFKSVNDQLGHTAGDEVLRQVAGLIQESVRDVDSVARYGGEEFAVVLPHTALDQAHALAERLRGNLERRAFELPDGHVRLTASIGVASFGGPDIGTVSQWIAATDAALYVAKAQGRNCVVAHSAGHYSPPQTAALCLVA
ncbi:MAG: diguanylate cyclase [Nitrospiraceae bacterium]|nr:diguanylate cyclase [Nitrospiraceae bacterium]